jgi:hypothetical protein
MARKTKFVREPRSALDFPFLKDIRQAVNALLNGTMTRGDVLYGDGNTVWDNAGGSASLSTFQLVSDGGDWYNCQAFDGVSASGSIVKVAKHQDLRCILPTDSPAGGAWPTKTVRSVTYTYTYTPTAGTTTDGVDVIEYIRGVTGDDASSETDYVTPCLNVGDIITAFSTSFAGPASLAGVTWQALADGRAWAAPIPPP